jgi:hypothetical protein
MHGLDKNNFDEAKRSLYYYSDRFLFTVCQFLSFWYQHPFFIAVIVASQALYPHHIDELQASIKSLQTISDSISAIPG